MRQICLILQGVVVGQWLLLRRSLLASLGKENQYILPLPLFYDRKRGDKGRGTLSLLLHKIAKSYK